jgi:hypothetical protein
MDLENLRRQGVRRLIELGSASMMHVGTRL